MEKVCSCCKESKKFEVFGVDKSRKDGRYVYCLDCASKKRASWNKKNKQRKSELSKKYRDANKEKIKTTTAIYLIKNKERIKKVSQLYRERRKDFLKELGRLWRKNNKYLCNFYCRKYQAYKGRATLRGFEKEMIEFYSNRPAGYHVDHIIPINHPDVCGLNVPWNLQYLIATENHKKGNKFNAQKT